ncbi:hypothetical protein [Aeromonas sp. HMWF016]|uniref:hypothetical protein n=1 Tax=Aeromonas sp. HMWF016 TaxID=2056852 RepID=UPI0015E8090B|nr:hypothetical protein [Aeromonas sp. HMWF016]
MHLEDACSQHFTFEMLFHCGETWQRIQCPNLPQQTESWLAYRELATHILEPLVDAFGHPLLTYGFCGVTLRKAILSNPSPGIAPTLDQHAACELNQRGRLVCPRQGAAVDLIYPGQNSYQVALWLAQHTPFDRLYLYGPDQPLHISYGPEQQRALVELTTHHERRVPKRLTLTQLKGMC